MNDKMSASADQCMQFYQQPLMDDGMGMDPFIEGLMDEAISSTEGMMLSPSNAQNNTRTSGHQLTPKGYAFKPSRRRSRASKSTPITLLKANTSNFRALVQQFTGRPSTTAMSLAIHKGPITLNFQQSGSKQQIHQYHTKITTSATLPPFSTTISSSNQVSVPLPKPQLRQDQQSGYLLDHVKSSNFLPTSGNSYGPISCMDDGFLFDNDFSLHEITMNAISNDINGLFM